MAETRISLSKRQGDGSRQVVLRSPSIRDVFVRSVLRRHVLPPNTPPVVRFQGEDALYLFHMDYLDRLLLTFPDADMSTGLRRRLSRRQMAELEALPDDKVEVRRFTGEFYRFQHQGINFCLNHLREHGVVMLNDEMGLGKTIQAIAIILKARRDRVLVVTTKSGCGAWAKILDDLFPRVRYQVIDGDAGKRAVKANAEVRIRLVNFEALRVKAFTIHGQPWPKNSVETKRFPKVWKPDNPDIFRQRYDMLIVDEFHKVKNPAAQQTQGFLQLPRCEHEMMMSGTPFLNSPLELWPVLHRMWPTKYPSYEVFEANLVIKDGDKVIAYNPDEMLRLRTWLNAHSLRRRKDQVGIQMPKVINTTVMVSMTPEQRRIYNRILREMRMELKDGTIRTILGALPQIIRLKQACFSPELFEGSANSAKLNEVRGIVEQLVRSGEKAIIFTQFEPGVRILRREFAEHNPAVVTGKINHTGPKRRAEQERFNTDDDCKLYIGTIQANQEAISLGAGTYVIMMDEEWSPSANDQAVARSAAGGLRGIAATVPVNVIKVQCEDSIEQWIDNLVESKRVLFNRTIEKDAGREMLVSKITLSDLKKMLRAA